MSAESFINELAALLRKHKAKYRRYVDYGEDYAEDVVDITSEEWLMSAADISRELPVDVTC